MKKKVLAVLAMVVALVPSMVVRAADYAAGKYVNFFTNDSEVSAYKDSKNYDVGLGTLIISKDVATDATNSHYYWKALGYIGAGGSSGILAAPGEEFSTTGTYESAADGKTYPTIAIPYVDGDSTSDWMTYIRNSVKSPYGKTDASSNVIIDIASKADLKTVFGIDSIGDTIELTDTNKAYLNAVTANTNTNVSYVFTTDKTGNKTGDAEFYYAVKVTKSSGVITSAELVEADPSGEEMESGVNYYLFTVLYMNDEYTCEEEATTSYSCYSCPSASDSTKLEYKWAQVGTQDAACTVVAKSKADCVNNVKTGVESYLIPAAIVLGVCAIVLTVVKRKDAFKAI